VAAAAARLLPLAGSEQDTGPVDPWDVRSGFRVNAAPRRDVEVVVAGTPARVRAVEVGRRAALLAVGPHRWQVGLPVPEPEEGRVIVALSPAGSAPFDDVAEGVWTGAGSFVVIDPALQVAWCDGEAFDIADTRGERLLEAVGGGDAVLAPMPGRLIQLTVAAGDTVARGQTVAVLEAMKMELALPAPRDGIVAAVGASAGAQVTEGTALVRLEPLI
jgi:3-methylcrotonyl-CoA carboxylase alpha subunit